VGNVYVILKQIYPENGVPFLSESPESYRRNYKKTFWSLFFGHSDYI